MKYKIWRYKECRQCYVMWPHLATPEVCTCGNDMTKNYNEKGVELVSFKDCSSNLKSTEDEDGS